MIFEKYTNWKYKYGNKYFGCKIYYVDTVGKMQKDTGIYSEPVKNDLEYD